MTYKNKWALVTGASAGIGATFARSLAAKGANLVLIARREERLEQLAGELAGKHGVATMIVAVDLATIDAPDVIFSALRQKGVAVDILVNNAGFGLPGAFHESDWRAHRDFIQLMATSYAHLAHLALTDMRAKGWGRIIQVASVAGLVPGSAGHTLYGATKSFLISFSQSLAAENAGSEIKVSAVCPGFTYSEFHDVNATRGMVAELPKYMFMKPEPVVEGAIAAVERGHVVYVPGRWNKFLVWLMVALPKPTAEKIVRAQSQKFRRK